MQQEWEKGVYIIPLDPKTMKNEGFKPPNMGSNL